MRGDGVGVPADGMYNRLECHWSDKALLSVAGIKLMAFECGLVSFLCLSIYLYCLPTK